MVEVYCHGLVATIYDHEEISIVTLNELNLCSKKESEKVSIIDTYRARVVPDLAQSHSWVLFRHSSMGIVFHDLILHQSQLLCHFHRLLLMGQHVLGHLVNDLLATLNIIFGPLHLVLKLLNLITLLESESVQLVLLSKECIAGVTNLTELVVCASDLALQVSFRLCTLIFLSTQLLLHTLLLIACRRLELLKLMLRVL